MKISAKLDYALRLLIKLTESPDKILHTAEIAKEERVSLKFLQAIVKELKDRNIIETFFGPNGGIQLAKPPEEIRFLDIYETFHNDLRIVKPCTTLTECIHIKACGIRKILYQGQMKMRDYFNDITLLDIYHEQIALNPKI